MDRTLVLAASAPIPVGHRVEVAEQLDLDSGTSMVVAITDLETGVRYQRAEEPSGELSVWQGRVRATTVTSTADGARTAVKVGSAPAEASAPASAADLALRMADAAAEAARGESDRWGSDPLPEKEPDRFW
ncbi:hypothetical protein OED01_10080 [Microbacterium sp. M28]|uniref:hypothetical protein n=1 Tax=Microbacterium sp. M28 TaxID=2962064 RepID=UPI0021F48B85|nr:hypothetical protein [Microbacterium sp. M28]UYO95956.1 hypothetical protein OED01_10080 [Microbacterium sp. M28]